MKNFSISCILLIAASCGHKLANVQRDISSLKDPTILIIGDSNLGGSFGEELHLAMMKWKEGDILSIAIGGGNPSYYTNVMKNKCCGHKVRFTSKDSKLISIIEKSSSKTSSVVLPVHNGELSMVLKNKNPSLLVLVLGTNSDSQVNYSALVKKIHDYNADLPIFWIGPPDDKAINAVKADSYIQNALNQFPTSTYHFFSSLEVAKHMHPGTAEAKKWVNGFIQELKGIKRK